MKRFKFRLEAVLTLRKREENVAMEKYASAVQEREAAASDLKRAESELSVARSDFHQDSQRGVAAERFAWMSDYFKHLERKCETGKRQLQARTESVKNALNGLMLAKRNREIVERFRDQQWKRFRQDFLREEEKLIEDLANRRASTSRAFGAFNNASAEAARTW